LEKEGKRIFKFEGVCLVLNSANEFPLSGSSDSQAFAGTIVAARNGDEAAFSFLFETYKARICTYLAHLIGNEEEGRDLAQDTFLKAWRALPQTHKALQFEAWLYRIATNTALDYLRSQKLRGLLWKGRGTPTATTATQNLGASYTGTLEDLSTNVSSHMTLTHVRQNNRLISGSFTSTLMRGNYSGYLDSSKHIFFTVANHSGGAPLYFTGTVQPAGNMEGSFCTIDQNNQCISGDVFGVWNVVPVR
jgi:hypothetical protein